MAWCVLDRVDGPCRPDHNLRKFEELLARYYRDEMPEAQRARLSPKHAGSYWVSVSQKFYYETGSVVDHKLVEPIAPHEFPTEVALEKNYSTLGSWLEFKRGIIAVDERMKVLIEELDPGVHRFWPLRLIKPNGQEFPTTYQGIVIGRFLDSFLPEATTPEAFEGGEEFYDGGGKLRKANYTIRGVRSKLKYTALVFSKEKTSGSHLWRERRMTDPQVLISDEMKAAIDATGLKVPTHYQVKVI